MRQNNDVRTQPPPALAIWSDFSAARVAIELVCKNQKPSRFTVLEDQSTKMHLRDPRFLFYLTGAHTFIMRCTVKRTPLSHYCFTGTASLFFILRPIDEVNSDEK